MKKKGKPSKTRHKRRASICNTTIQYNTEALVIPVREAREIKDFQIGKEVKLSLVPNDIP